MALPAGVVWEVRPTVGSDNNGGGFVTGAGGTDYSQQTSPQYALTGIASAGSGATVLYASAASVMVGNIAQVISGTNFTTGFFEVTSVSVGVSITFDRSVCTGVGASGVINIGGSLATISQAFTAAALDNTIYIKASASYTVSATLTIAGQNQTIGGMEFIGYTTTRGDNGQVTWTTSTNSVNLLTPGSAAPSNFTFRNINFTSTAGSPGSALWGGLGSFSGSWRFYNCTFNGFSNAILTYFSSGVHYDMMNMFFDSCEFKNCTSHAAYVGSQTFFQDCYFHGNTGDGSRCNYGAGTDTGGSCLYDRCIFYNNGGIGLTINGGGNAFDFNLPIIKNCIFYGNTNHGLDTSAIATGGAVIVINNIFVSNGGWGWNGKSSQQGVVSVFSNAYFNNTSGQATPAGFVSATDITLSGDPVNTAGSDWTLNSVSGEGAACKGVGYPSSVP
jgi:hypothetical protein